MAATVGPPSSAGGGAPATVTIDKHLDLERLAERARADADVARFHLHAALSELVELQSDVLHLQREASILHEQLQDTATTGAGAASPAAITTRGDLLAAVYRTERIRSKVASLDDLRNDIAAAEFRGQQLEHVHARLATEIVDGRKVSRDLGEVLAEEKKKAGDLNRREVRPSQVPAAVPTAPLLGNGAHTGACGGRLRSLRRLLSSLRDIAAVIVKIDRLASGLPNGHLLYHLHHFACYLRHCRSRLRAICLLPRLAWSSSARSTRRTLAVCARRCMTIGKRSCPPSRAMRLSNRR